MLQEGILALGFTKDYQLIITGLIVIVGTAKFFSPLGVDAYVKKSSIIYYSKKALKPVSRDIIQFAESEYLTAHANSIRVRFEDDKE